MTKQALTAHWTTSSAQRAESWSPPPGTRLGCRCCPAWTWTTVPSAVHGLWTAGIQAVASLAASSFQENSKRLHAWYRDIYGCSCCLKENIVILCRHCGGSVPPSVPQWRAHRESSNCWALWCITILIMMNTVTEAKAKPLSEIWSINCCKWALAGHPWDSFHPQTLALSNQVVCTLEGDLPPVAGRQAGLCVQEWTNECIYTRGCTCRVGPFPMSELWNMMKGDFALEWRLPDTVRWLRGNNLRWRSFLAWGCLSLAQQSNREMGATRSHQSLAATAISVSKKHLKRRQKPQDCGAASSLNDACLHLVVWIQTRGGCSCDVSLSACEPAHSGICVRHGGFLQHWREQLMHGEKLREVRVTREESWRKESSQGPEVRKWLQN